MAVLGAALGFSSCNETWDDNPVLKTHDGVVTADFLNNPVMQNQTIMITNDNKTGHFHLTCSQPDFGYAAIATYKVQCSLTEDFAQYEEISQNFYDCAEINPVNGDVAAAIEKLSGVQTENDLPLPYQKLYVRLRAFIAQDEANTTYLSNVVSFNAVAADYLAIWVADVPVNLFMRGGMNDWGAQWGEDGQPGPWQFITGTAENTWVLNNVTIQPDQSIKIATDNWEGINLGGPDGEENENAQKITAGEEYAMNQGGGSGHMRLTAPFTGSVHLRLEAGTYYVIFDPAK